MGSSFSCVDERNELSNEKPARGRTDTRMTGQSGEFYAVGRNVSTKHHEERPKSTECSALVTKCHSGTTHAGTLPRPRLPSGTAPHFRHITVAYVDQILRTSSRADVR